jgi:hypothetical protein
MAEAGFLDMDALIGTSETRALPDTNQNQGQGQRTGAARFVTIALHYLGDVPISVVFLRTGFYLLGLARAYISGQICEIGYS